jgi:hypothetical protein
MLRPKLLARISTYEVAPIGVRVLLLKGFRVNATIRRVEVEGLERAVGIEMVLWNCGKARKSCKMQNCMSRD